MDLTQLFGLVQALGLGAYAGYAVSAVGIAAILAAVLPPATAASAGWWRAVRPVLDWCAANKGNATNAPPSAPAPLPKSQSVPSSS